MGSFTPMHWIVVALVILVLFGRGRISETMGDFGKGISSFRKGLADEEREPAARPLPVAQGNPEPSPTQDRTPQP